MTLYDMRNCCIENNSQSPRKYETLRKYKVLLKDDRFFFFFLRSSPFHVCALDQAGEPINAIELFWAECCMIRAACLALLVAAEATQLGFLQQLAGSRTVKRKDGPVHFQCNFRVLTGFSM